MSAPLRQRVAAICEGLPGVAVAHVWGGLYETWQVGGRIFAGIGTRFPGVAVKCRDVETARMLIEAGVGSPARYFHRSWLLLPEDAAQDELSHRIAISYEIVRAKLPRRLAATLTEREGA